MDCRPGCGACCIAPSISSPIPGMPYGKPAGMPCVQLDDDVRCRIFGRPERPALNDQSLLEYSRSFTGNHKDLARQLGMSERTLYRRLKALEG